MLTTTIVTYILTMNDAAIVGVPKDTDIAAFLDSVAADAGYLAIRDDGGSAGGDGDGGDGGDHDFGQTDGLSPRDKTGASSA
jgi:hypothetical protein